MPENWKTYKLGEMAEIKYGKDHKILNDGDIPRYGKGGIVRYVDRFISEEESISIPRKGSLNNTKFKIVLILLFLPIFVFAQSHEDIYNKGIKHYLNKNYEAAILKFDEALVENPFHFNSYFKKSYAQYNLKQYQEGLRTIEQGFEFEPIDSRYFFMKAQFYDKLKETELALHYINMAIKLNKTKLSYYNYRADLNLELGNNKAAIKDYDYILSIEPDKYNIYYNRGLAENNNKNKINACLDWAFAQEKNANCQSMLHFKCSDIDLRPYERAVVKINTIVNPVFVCNDDSSLINFIRNKIGYPGACYERLEEGVVVLQINISNEGKLDTVILLHSVSEKLDSVALNAVKMSSPYWLRPAYMNSSAIPYSYVLPIRFKINEPYFKEQAILDSIHKMAMLDDSEAEYGYLKKYYNLNPFNYEKLLRLKKLSKKLNMGLTESEFIDYSSIEAEFLDEVVEYQKIFKFYFDDFWKVTEKEKASYYILTDAYPFSTGIANYTVFSMDMRKYSTGGMYKGKQDGYYKDYFKDGTLRCEMVFKNGMPINFLKTYFPDGELNHEIFMNQRQFEIRQYKGALGNNLLDSKEIVWEFSNIRDGARDSLHLVCHFSPKNQKGTWSLFKGGKIVCEETYLKGKFESCFLFDGTTKTESKDPYISSDFLIPMSVLFYHEIQYSSSIKPETLQLIKSFDPDLNSQIMLIWE